MGEIVKVKVGHNGKGSGSEWQLDKIEIQRVPNEGQEILGDTTTFYFDGKVIRKGKQYEGNKPRCQPIESMMESYQPIREWD